tara:strand:+ start:200 stop:571 length:372 start_codon:yes stop_codon:yes gene_type:complete
MKNNEKNFGIFLSIICFFIYFYFLFFEGENNSSFLIISIIFLILSFFKPIFFYFPNKIWIKIGFLLGKFISPLIMLLIYFSVIFLTYIYIKLLKKDILKLNFLKNKSSYWEKHENHKNYFKQY